jgi:pimeloyl-ACP methyl ester carboxylesterase
MMTFPDNSTAVLVHGAWADGSCWTNVIGRLKQEGLNVICAPIPLTSLTDDIAALGRVLERTSGPVVLAGHAYGGAVIQAASDERVKSLVYVAALAPDEGETVANVFYRDEPHAEAPKLAPNKHGCLWMPEEAFGKAVAHKAAADLDSLHPADGPYASLENEADVVSAGRRRSHDQSEDAALYGGADAGNDSIGAGGSQPDVHRAKNGRRDHP